jgi:hypothetical protein
MPWRGFRCSVLPSNATYRERVQAELVPITADVAPPKAGAHSVTVSHDIGGEGRSALWDRAR